MATLALPTTIGNIKSASSITSIDKLKLIILGEPGVGKDWLAATGRKPILTYDFDDRAASIAGKSEVYIKTLFDADPNQPSAWQTFETDVASIGYEIGKGTFPFKQITISSLQFLLKAAQNQLMKDQAGLSRTIKIGNKSYRITSGWDAINGSQKMIEGILNNLFELPVDVVVTSHVTLEKAKDWTLDNPKFTGKYTIDPNFMKLLLPMFNERWLLMNDYGKWEVLMKPDSQFNAVTALHIGETNTMEADIQKILAVHTENIKNGR